MGVKFVQLKVRSPLMLRLSGTRMGVANLIHSFVLSVKVGPEPSEDPPVRGCQRESPEIHLHFLFWTKI